MKSPMKEREQGYAVLEELTSDTFDRFLEWIYRGFYTAPHPKIVEASSPTLPDTSAIEGTNQEENVRSVDEFVLEPNDVVDIGRSIDEPVEEPIYGSSGFGFSSTKNKAGKKLYSIRSSDVPKPEGNRKSLREAFISRPYKTFRSAVPIPPARKNENKNEDYTDVFLAHARLYVFANNYLIYDLKTLALENLHETLKCFQLYSHRTQDIISLIHYVYQNTKILDDGEIEPMRAILVEYVSFEMDILMKDSAFNDLVTGDEILDAEQRRSLFDDCIAAVLKRI